MYDINIIQNQITLVIYATSIVISAICVIVTSFDCISVASPVDCQISSAVHSDYLTFDNRISIFCIQFTVNNMSVQIQNHITIYH